MLLTSKYKKFFEKYFRDFFIILFFSFIYIFISNEDFLKLGSIFALLFLLLLLLDFFQKKHLSFQYLLVVSFLMLLPLTFSSEVKSIYLPFGYQYIYLSLISSLIYVDSKRINLKVPFRKRLYNSFIASIAPGSYLSGPSATLQEIETVDKNIFGLPSLAFIRFSNIKLAISGSFRLSLGFYLNTLNPYIFNDQFFFNEELNLYKKFIVLVAFGFYNFWRYYLLFSGASEICKSLLSLFDIKVIDNFNNPEISILYHEIWGKWHLNITKRIRDFLYTPLTLFILRNFNPKNKNIKFLLIEGLPVIILFFILALWHGGRNLDFIFAAVSAVLTISSRAISQNNILKKNLLKIRFFQEIIRILNLSLFGLVLGIYDFRDKISIDFEGDIKFILYPFLLVTLIYIYYRWKLESLCKKKNDKEVNLHAIYILIFEFSFIIFVNLFLLINLDEVKDFIYFAN